MNIHKSIKKLIHYKEFGEHMEHGAPSMVGTPSSDEEQDNLTRSTKSSRQI